MVEPSKNAGSMCFKVPRCTMYLGDFIEENAVNMKHEARREFLRVLGVKYEEKNSKDPNVVWPEDMLQRAGWFGGHRRRDEDGSSNASREERGNCRGRQLC